MGFSPDETGFTNLQYLINEKNHHLQLFYIFNFQKITILILKVNLF